jgi:hypothetical protein
MWGRCDYRVCHVLLCSKPNPNLAKSSKIQPSPAKGNQRKRLGFPWIPLSELSLFKGLQRPPRSKIPYLLPFSPLAFVALGALRTATKQGTTTSDFRKGLSMHSQEADGFS